MCRRTSPTHVCFVQADREHRDNVSVLPCSSQQENADLEKFKSPNGGYGWVCVVCVFLINAHTWGLNFVSWPLGLTLEGTGQEVLTCRLHVAIHGADLVSQ